MFKRCSREAGEDSVVPVGGVGVGDEPWTPSPGNDMDLCMHIA